MTSDNLPLTMKAWQITANGGSIETILKLNTSAPLPEPKPDQHLVRILAGGINPVDYKVAEVAFASRAMIPKPGTPGVDFVGRIVKPASSGSSLKEGQLVFGTAGGSSDIAAGALAEYAAVNANGAAPVPESVDPVLTAGIGVAGQTAYQSIMPYVKAGSKVFINGGSGGTGIFGIQFAKAAGCHVTTSCSTANVELCKSLGADDVIDYKKGAVLEALQKRGPFDHVVDNVGNDYNDYWRAHDYTVPSAKFVFIAAGPSLSYLRFALTQKLLPGFLGGGKRKMLTLLVQPSVDDLSQIGKWMVEGKVKSIVDSKFAFEQTLEAFTKLKTGRAKGKIIVEGSSDK